jgi:hypothetical protein
VLNLKRFKFFPYEKRVTGEQPLVVTKIVSCKFFSLRQGIFLIPWIGGASLGPFLCPTTEEKKGLLPQSMQGPKTCIE